MTIAAAETAETAPLNPLVMPVPHLWHALGDLLFPPRCPLCGTWGSIEGNGFCRACDDRLAAERSRPFCPTCAADVAAWEVKLDRCGDCRGRSLKVAGTVRIGSYRGDLGPLLRSFKYSGREELTPIFGAWLTDAVRNAPWSGDIEAVVSVPTHWKRRWHRPFHAADALADELANRLGWPHVSVLRRVRGGPHQIGLSYSQRALNVRGAFALVDGVELRGARVLLVDDVRTTGATIEECAKVLRRGGAEKVFAAVALRVCDFQPGSPTPTNF